MTCHFIAVFKSCFLLNHFKQDLGILNHYHYCLLLLLLLFLLLSSLLPCSFSLSPLLPFWIWNMPGMCPTIELLPGPRDLTFQSLMICPQPLGSLFVTLSWRERETRFHKDSDLCPASCLVFSLAVPPTLTVLHLQGTRPVPSSSLCPQTDW